MTLDGIRRATDPAHRHTGSTTSESPDEHDGRHDELITRTEEKLIDLTSRMSTANLRVQRAPPVFGVNTEDSVPSPLCVPALSN
jgi:hypothetical protein